MCLEGLEKTSDFFFWNFVFFLLCVCARCLKMSVICLFVCLNTLS